MNAAIQSNCADPSDLARALVGLKVIPLDRSREPYERIISDGDLKIRRVSATDLWGLEQDAKSESVMTDDASAESSKNLLDDSTKIPPLAEVLPAMNSRFIFIESPISIFDRHTAETMFRRDFLHLTENRHAIIETPKGVQRVNVGREWLAWPHRRQASSLAFAPGEKPFLTDRKVNLWRGWGAEPQRGDVGLWNTLLDHIFGKVKSARRWFEQWCAYPIRHPGAKLYSAVVLQGPPGAGKSLTGEIIGGLYGEHFAAIGPETIFDNFNSWIACKQFVLCDEISSRGKDAADWLKILVTGETISANEKYKPRFTVRNAANFLLSSNRASPILVEGEDRRYFVWSVQKLIGDELGDEIARWSKSKHGKAALFDYFQTFDLAGFRPHASPPPTEAKFSLIEIGRSDVESFAHQVTTEAKENERPALATLELLIEEFDPHSRKRTTKKALSVALYEAGARSLLRQVKIQGRKFRFWALTRPDFWQDASPQAIRDEIMKWDRSGTEVGPKWDRE